ncbi:MAG TPA: GNAT family N-acetyltransferase [Pirellulales bacterium]|nr:GNAT family N-acetyltransferase [Pirellulales bacterium]
MIGFRSFRNSDPPHLAEIWRTRSGLRGYVQPMTSALLERLVFSKPYFDQAGLVLATDEERPLGFAHAGFGPVEDESALSHEMGASILTMVSPHPDEAAIAAELIGRSEAYLRANGAKVIYGGGIRPLNAFYVGLYGGSELPGILDSDAQHQGFFRAAGYREIDHTAVLHRELSDFRPVVDRQQMLLRRRLHVDCVCDPPLRTWWEACTLGDFTRLQYRLFLKDEPQPAGVTTLIDMEAFSHTWGARTAGLVDVFIGEAYRRQGMGVWLVGEILRQAAEQGFGLIEVQTMQHNTAALAMYAKLGFQQVDQGAVFRKET